MRQTLLSLNCALTEFLLLLLQVIGESNEEQRAILLEKEKHEIPFPFCFHPVPPFGSGNGGQTVAAGDCTG